MTLDCNDTEFVAKTQILYKRTVKQAEEHTDSRPDRLKCTQIYRRIFTNGQIDRQINIHKDILTYTNKGIDRQK